MRFRILLLLLSLSLASTATTRAATLSLVLRDARSGAPAAARLEIFSQEGSALHVPDPSLHTHLDQAGVPYLYAEDRLDLALDPGLYQVRVLGGPARIPRQYTVDLTGDRQLQVEVERWIDPREWGWICADPHVHLTHSDQSSVYPLPTVDEVGRMARAEDLDLLYLLENHMDSPSGAVKYDQSGSLVVWGEEFRSGFWGHVVILGARTLVTVDGNPWANGPGLAGWPLLQKVLESAHPPLAYIAHPHTGGSSNYALGWPETGEARELESLAMSSLVVGVATGSWSNDSPRPWNLQPLLDGLEAGAEWASLGETDAVLDRAQVPPVGSLRTYAYLLSPAPAAHPLLDRQWRSAVRARRTYASSGPLLLQCRLDGAMLGDHLQLSGNSALLRLHLVSWTPITRVTIHGRSGRWQDLPVDPSETNEIDLTATLEFPHDDAIFVEAVAMAGTWFAPEDSLRLCSSPIFVERGVAAPVPVATARRNADDLLSIWRQSVKQRDYSSPADSAAARSILLGGAAKWEALADDPPGAFQLIWPEPDRTVGETGCRLLWHHAREYDGEALRYVVELSPDPTFDSAVVYPAREDTFLDVRELEPGDEYWWRVRAEEPDGDATLNEGGSRRFAIEPQAVAAPAATGALLRLGLLGPSANGLRFELHLSRPAEVSMRWMDVRGRVVRSLPAEEYSAGPHEIVWDGRDDRGSRVASGVFWLLAEAAGERRVMSAVLLRP